MNKYYKYGLLAARILLGATFLFSGFVKAIDPQGSVYKFDEYFLAFGWNLSENFIQLLSIVQAAFEFSLGVLLMLCVWPKITKRVAFLFMLIMTPFTLYLAFKNPVSDCGCFGDVLVLTNWQTFSKNVILLLLSLVLLISKGGCYSIFGKRTSKWCLLWSVLFPVLISMYAYRHLPLMDFRPFKVGNDLKELTQLPPGAVTDSFYYNFIYEKEGVRKSFKIDELAQVDSDWTFVDREQILVREGERPVIYNLNIEHPIRGEIRDDILNDTSYVFLFISPKLEDADRMYIDKVNSAYEFAELHGYKFYGLTASAASAIDEWSYEYDAGYEFCSLDDKVAETIIRSNPGIMLLKNGVVINKWASSDIPDFSKVDVPFEMSDLGSLKKTNAFRVISLLTICFLVPLIFFGLLHTGSTLHLKRKNKK